MYHAKNCYVKIDNTEMEYVTFGNGIQPFIIIPGLGDALKTVRGTAVPFSYMYRIYAKYFKVYLFSRKNMIPKDYKIADMADDQAKVLKTLGISDACVMGVSQGGMISMHLAAKYPELVTKLVLANTAPYAKGYIVSCCVGHLVELATPESYDEKYEKWRYDALPILPSQWNYQITDATRKQFSILKKLMEREDVTGLVEATDAGREGELIFRLVYDQAKCKKPFERLWISSMEDQAISDGFSNLKNGREYDDLYKAALCRERADWIVGMNATRLFSTLYGQTLNVGRVMTPTLG